MIIHDMEQGTDEWFKARLGIPTASRFKDIYTSTGKASASADGYMYTLIAESIAGKTLESFSNGWMERGTELEPGARTYWELTTGKEAVQVGFITDDDRTAGCSPDAVGLEIKCPSPGVHIKYLCAGKCPSEYFPQVQGCMWLMGMSEWDFMSYHPDLPPFLITVQRDDEYISGLADAIKKFNEKMKMKMENIK